MTEKEALAALGTVVDPEVGIDIVELGLIVNLEISPDRVLVDMILTNGACPMGGHLRGQAEAALSRAAGPQATVEVAIVEDPVWTPERMSAIARTKLGW